MQEDREFIAVLDERFHAVDEVVVMIDEGVVFVFGFRVIIVIHHHCDVFSILTLLMIDVIIRIDILVGLDWRFKHRQQTVIFIVIFFF